MILKTQTFARLRNYTKATKFHNNNLLKRTLTNLRLNKEVRKFKRYLHCIADKHRLLKVIDAWHRCAKHQRKLKTIQYSLTKRRTLGVKQYCFALIAAYCRVRKVEGKAVRLSRLKAKCFSALVAYRRRTAAVGSKSEQHTTRILQAVNPYSVLANSPLPLALKRTRSICHMPSGQENYSFM